MKKEGFWFSKSEPHLPLPIPNVLTPNQADQIYEAIVYLQDTTAKSKRYRGWSSSRITGEILGNEEYSTDEWCWPGDFASHYVLRHGVKPSDEFLGYLGIKL